VPAAELPDVPVLALPEVLWVVVVSVLIEPEFVDSEAFGITVPSGPGVPVAVWASADEARASEKAAAVINLFMVFLRVPLFVLVTGIEQLRRWEVPFFMRFIGWKWQPCSRGLWLFRAKARNNIGK
jgi:hypothetical protein